MLTDEQIKEVIDRWMPRYSPHLLSTFTRQVQVQVDKVRSGVESAVRNVRFTRSAFCVGNRGREDAHAAFLRFISEGLPSTFATELEELESWGEDTANLEEAIDSRLTGLNRLISQDMMEVINRLGVEFNPVAFSTRTNLGFNRLYSEISRVFMAGEPFTT